MTPARAAELNALKKEREQALDQIKAAARFLTGPQQRDLSVNLRKLATEISRMVKANEAKR